MKRKSNIRSCKSEDAHNVMVIPPLQLINCLVILESPIEIIYILQLL